ncbi:hypothetical protein D7Y48_05525 [Stenotrophomonas maltophilia]|nr:hypothetical protein [Stenotrophomonas maltophilia]PZT22734.1 hypothetical protein A7X88_02975 [Stenotrophomonas maltophilia]
MVFLDDTGFDKIVDRPSAVMMCAGSMKLIALWKTWFVAGTGPMPVSEFYEGSFKHEICVAVVRKRDFGLRFSAGTYENFEDAAEFCGTGAIYAKDCYSVNGCAKTAVLTASRHDPMTGGEVKFVDTKVPFSSNVMNPSTTVEEVEAQLATKGFVMEKSTGNVFSIATGQQVHQQAMSAAIAAGLSAPTGQKLRSWTEREREDLQKVMNEILEDEAAANNS